MHHLYVFIAAIALIVAAACTPLNNTLLERDLPPYDPFAPKRGLLYHDVKYIRNFHGGGSQVSWANNWASNMDPAFPRNVEFVPMLWGDGADHTSVWFNNVNNALSRGSTHLLAFNEPDKCASGISACMSPQAAANAYRAYMNPFAGRAYLGAPAVSNGAGGLPWLTEFLRLCTGCHIDFIPIHWYDSATNVAYFKSYIQHVKAIVGSLNIWVSEFNGSGSVAQQEAFMREVLPWLDSQRYVSHHVWYWCDPKQDHQMVDWNGNPTSLGNVYAYTGF